jgi:hypothetical protein
VVARRSRHNPSESAWFGPNAPRAAARQDVFWPPSSAPHAQSWPRNEVRRSGGQGVAGSNPVSPTKHSTLNDLVGVGFTNYGPPGQKRSPSIEHCLHIRTQIAHRNGRVLVPAHVSCIGATAHAPTTASRPGWRSHSNPGKGVVRGCRSHRHAAPGSRASDCDGSDASRPLDYRTHSPHWCRGPDRRTGR